ncbi:MAG: KTSC domain-containing protein [Methanofollis sp.]|uniref:KTSC domain-containing protein n=1 Tax=Methanofollis sp. TaxID=2052835 RepID=UPI00261F70FD|nr:KTSC domain-containing protein [Methanofollis sp.]MDD4253867.1 KTSC domain-containing protein [Methanofollis sp.]
MLRQTVTSTTIQSVGYSSLSGTLEIEFTHGSLYQFSDVPASVYRELMAASSHGTYFNEHIKEWYHFRKIR